MPPRKKPSKTTIAALAGDSESEREMITADGKSVAAPPRPTKKVPARKRAPAAKKPADDAISDHSDDDAAPAKKAPAKRGRATKKKADDAVEDVDEEQVEHKKAPAKRGKAKKDEPKDKEVEKKVPAKRGKSAAKKVEAPVEREESEDELAIPRKAAPAAKKPTAARAATKKAAVKSKEASDEEPAEEAAPAPKKRGRATKAAENPPEKEKPAPKKRMTKKEKEASEKAAKEVPETQDVDADGDVDMADEIAPTPTQVHSKPQPAEEDDMEEDELTSALAPSLVKIQNRRKGPNVGLGAGGNIAKWKPTKAGQESDDMKELRREHEKLQAQFARLKDLRETEAERLLEKWKKASATKEAASQSLISTLQEDLNGQAKAVAEAKSLKKKLAAGEKEWAKEKSVLEKEWTKERSALEKEWSKERTVLQKAAQDSAKEIQVLSAKLKAAEAKNVAMPGSAIKAPGRAGGLLGFGTAKSSPAEEALQISRAKEQLYSDLTGLLIMDVKREDESTGFDCLQTGSLGTFPFRLRVRTTPSTRPKTPAKPKPAASQSTDGDDDESEEPEDFIFVPKYSSPRDDVVIEALPEYLKGEISFEKEHAIGFYHKIFGILMQSMVEEGEEVAEEELEVEEEQSGLEESFRSAGEGEGEDSEMVEA